MGSTGSVLCVQNCTTEPFMLEVLFEKSPSMTSETDKVLLIPDRSFYLPQSQYQGKLHYNLFKVSPEGIAEFSSCAQHSTNTDEKMIEIVNISPGFPTFRSSFDHSERDSSEPCIRVQNLTENKVHVIVEDKLTNKSEFYLTSKIDYSTHVFRSWNSDIVHCTVNLVDSPDVVTHLTIDNSKVKNYTCFSFVVSSSPLSTTTDNNNSSSLLQLTIDTEYTSIRDNKRSLECNDGEVVLN
jgi:hypothetical protein